MSDELIGQRVRVHLNLHRGDWSVTIKGKVVANVQDITLEGVSFYVCESMRLRTVETGRRKVHGWAQGTVVAVDSGAAPLPGRVSYNPYASGSFTLDGTPVDQLAEVRFTPGKRATA